MKNIIHIFIVVLLCSTNVFAQKKTDANVHGHVVCKTSEEHLPFINISVKGTTIGTATDETGHFFLKNLPLGKHTLVATGMGYKSLEKEVKLEAGKTIEVNFEIEESVIQLDGVVVSANKNETNRKEAPAIINVITPKLFENTNSVCLAQGLNYQPGLRVETNCQNCGYQQVRINGLDGPYSQILIDSRPIFSSLAGVYGIEQIPANMIDRVEIMRGGGSAIFGSNAIAGTINIITKEPTTNSFSVSNTTNLVYGKSTDINTSLNASVVSDDYKTGVMIFGSSRQRSPFDYDGDGFTEIGKIEAQNIGMRGYYKISNYSKLSFEYHHLSEFRRGGNKLDLPPHESDITEQLGHNINTGGLSFDMFSPNQKHRGNVYLSAQKVNRKSYYGANQDPLAYGKTDDATFVGGLQYSYKMDNFLFMPAELTAGAEYNMNELTDEVLGYNRTMNQAVNTSSIFLQNEWKNKKLSILIGGRIDKHKLIKNPIISPRINLRYNPNENINFRASYSSGFRAPQAFDEDLHINVVGGEPAFIILDENLKTEKSQSISASVDFYKSFGNVQTNLLIEGFYTNLNNVFVLETLDSNYNGGMLLKRTNGAGAVVQGINIEGKIIPASTLQFQFGFTLQQSRYKEALSWSLSPNIEPQKKMFRSPNHYGYLTATYEPFSNLEVSLSGTYTGSMLVQHFAGYIAEDTEKETSEFYDVNIKLSYEFQLTKRTKLQLNGGVQNIFNSYQKDFDQGVNRDSGYIYGPGLPRTVFFGLKFYV